MTKNVIGRSLKVLVYTFTQLLFFSILFLMKEYNYNLFHAFVECYGIAVSLGVCFIVLNSNQYIDNNFIKVLSIGFLYLIFIDFLHMLAFKGMNIIIGYDANLPTQLWIFSRYFEALTLLLAAVLISKKIKVKALYIIYFCITAGGLISIFARFFPDAFIEGRGLTPFKIISEYVIIGIIIIAFLLLFLKRGNFDKNVLRYFYLSFSFSILTDLLFTFYADPFDVFNLLGHYFKILSVYYIYKAVIQVAIKSPQDIIFREIESRKNELEKEVSNNILQLEALNRSQAALINSLQELVFVLDDQLILRECHYPESDILYVAPENKLNKHIDQIGFPEPAKSIIKEALEETLQHGKPSRAEYYLDLPRGRSWFDIQVSIIPGNGIIKEKLLCTVRDISERKQMEEVIFNEKEQFKTTLFSIGDGVISTDVLGRILVVNNVAENLTGWCSEEALGKPLAEVFHAIHEITREKCTNPVRKVLETADIIKLGGYTLLLSKTDKEIPIEVSAAPIKSSTGEATGIVIVFRDITEKREKQRQIEYLSFHDSLTGQYNRRYMTEILKKLDTEANLPLAIMVLDVNGLKLTNDAFGHQTGDQLLKIVAKVMKEACRAGDIIGRYGGDEFVIVLPNTNEAKAKEIQEKIVSTASQVTLDSVIVSLAAGYAVKTRVDQDIEIIITNADNNMYKNKRKYGKVMHSQTIETVLRNINQKYASEQIHTERVSEYCEAIAKAMQLREKEIRDIKTAGSLHDLGKITLPAELLNKPDRLTEEEYEAIKKHPETGYQMLRSVDEYVPLADFVLHHHERWDGKGYPSGLAGEDIPLESRIISVADVYEAMTAKRPYQKTKTKEEAITELKRCAGTQFDPEIVNVFVEKVL